MHTLRSSSKGYKGGTDGSPPPELLALTPSEDIKQAHQELLRTLKRSKDLRNATKAIHRSAVKWNSAGKEYFTTMSTLSSTMLTFTEYIEAQPELVNHVKYFGKTLKAIAQERRSLVERCAKGFCEPLSNFIDHDFISTSEAKKKLEKARSDYESAVHTVKSGKKARGDERKQAELVQEMERLREGLELTSADLEKRLEQVDEKVEQKLLRHFYELMEAQYTFFQRSFEIFKSVRPRMDKLKQYINEANSRSEDVSMHPVKEGYLMHNSHGIVKKAWSRNWYVLKDGLLYCKKEGKDFDKDSVLDIKLCTVRMQSSVNAEEGGDPGTETKFRFEIVTPGRKKALILQAESEQERAEWVKAIQDAIGFSLNAQKLERSNSMAVKENDGDSEHSKRLSQAQRCHTLGAAIRKPNVPSNAVLQQTLSASNVAGRDTTDFYCSNTGQDEETSARLLKVLQRVPGNHQCADCRNPEPDWASINIGVLICLECSGVHRSLGTHISKVRSLTLDKWDPELVMMMKCLGNERTNAILEYSMKEDQRLDAKAPTEVRREWIKAKYVEKKYMAPSTFKSERSLRKAIFDFLREQALRQTIPEGRRKRMAHKDEQEDKGGEHSEVIQEGIAVDGGKGMDQDSDDDGGDEQNEEATSNNDKTQEAEAEDSDAQEKNTKENAEGNDRDTDTDEDDCGRLRKTGSVNSTSSYQQRVEEEPSEDEKEDVADEEDKENDEEADQEDSKSPPDILHLITLILQGSDVNWSSNKYDHQTPLHQAVLLDSIVFVEALIQNGASVGPIDDRGWSPMHYAAYLNHSRSLNLLLKRASKNIRSAENLRDLSGKMPHELALQQGCREAYCLLKSHPSGYWREAQLLLNESYQNDEEETTEGEQEEGSIEQEFSLADLVLTADDVEMDRYDVLSSSRAKKREEKNSVSGMEDMLPIVDEDVKKKAMLLRTAMTEPRSRSASISAKRESWEPSFDALGYIATDEASRAIATKLRENIGEGKKPKRRSLNVGLFSRGGEKEAELFSGGGEASLSSSLGNNNPMTSSFKGKRLSSSGVPTSSSPLSYATISAKNRRSLSLDVDDQCDNIEDLESSPPASSSHLSSSSEDLRLQRRGEGGLREKGHTVSCAEGIGSSELSREIEEHQKDRDASASITPSKFTFAKSRLKEASKFGKSKSKGKSREGKERHPDKGISDSEEGSSSDSSSSTSAPLSTAASSSLVRGQTLQVSKTFSSSPALSVPSSAPSSLPASSPLRRLSGVPSNDADDGDDAEPKATPTVAVVGERKRAMSSPSPQFSAPQNRKVLKGGGEQAEESEGEGASEKKKGKKSRKSKKKNKEAEREEQSENDTDEDSEEEGGEEKDKNLRKKLFTGSKKFWERLNTSAGK
ncbi:ADP-ribosylation factor GTPase-activating protein [Balamuthia mandrillaris]